MADTNRCSRISAFKNTNRGSTELRRKRVELSVALRKKARDDQLLKRRALSPDSSHDAEASDVEKLPTPEEIVMGLKSSVMSVAILAAKAARRMLSREQNPPISILLSAGIVKPLVELLDRDDNKDLQFEAAWALTNIASGTHDHTMAVVNGGAISKLVRLLATGGSVGEQCAWALGNIAGDGPEPRDLVLEAGALAALMPSLLPTVTASQVRTAVWTYSNLCRNKNPMVKFESVAPALPYISDLLELSDPDVLADACWALSYLSDGPNDRIEAVQTTPKLLSRLIKLLDYDSHAVRTPALRAMGNMVTGSDEQTDRCLKAGCLEYLVKLLRSGKSSLIKEASWAVSNVLAGTQTQIQAVIDKGVLHHIIHVVANEDARSQKEAAWAITNMCMGATAPQLGSLLDAGALPPFCALLSSPDPRTIVVILEGITHLLMAAEKLGEVEQLALRLEEIGVVDRLEALQQHENEQVYTKVMHIIDTYFANDEDEEAAPAQNEDEFQFGVSNQELKF